MCVLDGFEILQFGGDLRFNLNGKQFNVGQCRRLVLTELTPIRCKFNVIQIISHKNHLYRVFLLSYKLCCA